MVKGWGNKVFGLGKQRSAQILQELKGLKEIPLEDEENSTGCRTLLGNLIQLKSHHMRVWKEGLEPAKTAAEATLEDRFLAFTDRASGTRATGCWPG